MKKLFILAIALTALACSSTVEETVKAENKNPVMYEIFVQSFADSDGDGIGDIKGMTSKLDYLQEMGIGGIWLMPINPSPSYHKYDVTDYYDIHPDYGTIEDFKEFVQEAHARDIAIVMDMVINHSSDQHPTFLASAANEDVYRGFYVWADRDSIAEQIEKSETSFDSGNITQWHAFKGDSVSEHYYGFFTGAMPDMNFDYQPVRDEVLNIAQFWLEEIEVDGFRLDAAKHIYPDERADDSADFWKEYLSSIQQYNPDVYTVGEVWANADFVSNFVGGFSALFNFDLAFSILESVKREEAVTASIEGHGWRVDEGTFIKKLEENRSKFTSVNPDFQDAIFLSNHDQNRYLDVLEGDEIKARLAVNILLTLPGRPYLYYGEEIGMHGMKPDPNIREPFLWKGDNDQERATWIEPEFSKNETVTPLSDQINDEGSMYSHYKKWITTRNSNPVLHSGEIESVTNENSSLLMFKRTLGEESLLIVHNLSTESQAIELADDQEVYFGSLEGTKMAPLSTVIIK